MYRTKDPLFLPEFRQTLPDSDALYSFITEQFHISHGEVGTSSSLRASILCLAYMCQYITYEELSVFLGPYFSTSAVRRMISRLVDSNILRREKFDIQDSYSRYAYCLTKSAVEYAGSFFPLECRQKLKVRRSKGTVPEHDYSAGINMFHLLASPLAFTWKKEFMYGGIQKVKRSLCVDYVVPIVNDAYPVRLYIEQDMGTETIGRLVEKIEIYEDHNISSDPASILIFSFRSVQPAFARTSFLNGYFSSMLLESMEAAGEKSLWDYYEHFCNGTIPVPDAKTAGYDFSLCLKQFLVMTGVCRAEDSNGASSPDGTDVSNISAAAVSKNTRLVRIGNHDFTFKDLKRYCTDEDAMVNPYCSIYANRQQAISAFRKELSILGVLSSYIRHGHINRACIRVLLGGFPVYAVPTALFGNYLKYLMPDRFGLIDKYCLSLSAYYTRYADTSLQQSNEKSKPNGRFSDGEGSASSAFSETKEKIGEFHRIMPSFRLLLADPAITLRNCFPCGNGAICIENGHDISALTRAFYIGENYAQSNILPYSFLHFVFIVNTAAEAIQIAKALSFFTEDSYVNPKNSTFAVYFLLATDMGKSLSLKAVIQYDDPAGNEYELFSVLPDSEKKKDISNMDFISLAHTLFGSDQELPDLSK